MSAKQNIKDDYYTSRQKTVVDFYKINNGIGNHGYWNRYAQTDTMAI